MQKEKLTNLELAIVSSHTIRRFLMGYKPHERTNAIEQMLKKISKPETTSEAVISVSDDVLAKEIEDAIEERRSCDGCKHSPEFNNDNFADRCGTCQRFYGDGYERD